MLPHGVLETPRTGMSRPTARTKLGIPGDARVVLCFGNIRPYKGVDVLLRAFADVARDDPEGDARHRRASRGATGRRTQQLIDELGIAGRVRTRLEYIPTDEIEQFFVAADVVALPYTHFDAQSGVGARARCRSGGRSSSPTPAACRTWCSTRRPSCPPAIADALARALSRVLA